MMHYLQLSVLLVLAAMPLCDLSMPLELAPLWDDMQVKHTWNAILANWESLGRPPASATIDLHIALKAHHEGLAGCLD
jgi:hypothetical protein